jgi:hypothetical protein
MKIRSLPVNLFLLLIGTFLLILGADAVHKIILHRNSGYYLYDFFKIFVLFGTGVWSVIGGYKNLKASRKPSPQTTEPATSYRLAKLHLLVLLYAGSVYLIVGLLHWKFALPGLYVVKIVHYIFVTIFALIPVTLVIHLVKRG